MVFVGSPEGLRLQTRDRVWEIEVSETEYLRLQASGKVVSSRRVPGGIAGRVVAADNPGGAGRPVEPDLQDAYIAAMEVVDHALVRHCGAGGVEDPAARLHLMPGSEQPGDDPGPARRLYLSG